MSTDMRLTTTITDFIIAGKSSDILSYSKLSFIEVREGIEFPVTNILKDYLYEFKQKAIKVTLSESEQYRYKYRPKILANDVYGNSELYFVIMALNNVCNIKEFDFTAIYMLKVEDMEDYISKIYNSEKANILRYNNQ